MYVYPSVDELMNMNLSKSGSVVLVPSRLLSLMIRVLEPANLDLKESVRLVSAPFYVLKVPTLPAFVRYDMSEQDFRFGAKAEISASATSTTSVSGTITAAYRHKNVTGQIRAPNPVSPVASVIANYVEEVEGIILDLRSRHKSRIAGKPVFLYYSRVVDQGIIDLLSTIEADDVPTYVIVPINLNEVNTDIVDAVKPFAMNGKVSILLGIDPLPVRVMVGKTEKRLPVTRYLVANMFDGLIDENLSDRPEDKFNRCLHLADYVMHLVFEDVKKRTGETQQEAEEKYSISTVFLNALYERLIHEYRPRRHKYRHDTIYETLHDICESAKETALDQRQTLAKYARLLGVTDDTIKVIKSTGWIFEPYGFASSWAMETKKYRKHREEAEEVLSV